MLDNQIFEPTRSKMKSDLSDEKNPKFYDSSSKVGPLDSLSLLLT